MEEFVAKVIEKYESVNHIRELKYVLDKVKDLQFLTDIDQLWKIKIDKHLHHWIDHADHVYRVSVPKVLKI